MISPTLEQREAMRQRPKGLAVGHQHWSDLLFAHWEIDPDAVQKTLPAGLRVDTHEGRAFIGVVPFFMERIRPSFLPPLPWLSWFLELNVRTYVHDGQGLPGVWFYSLDCNQPVAVRLARRIFHLPYFDARISARRRGWEVDYLCCRRGSEQVHYHWTAPAESRTAEPGSLEFFLLERYVLFATDGRGCVFQGRVHHQPYRYGSVTAKTVSNAPAKAAGFELPSQPCSLLAAERVAVEIFPLRKIEV